MAKPKPKRIYQNKMSEAAQLYCSEAEKCTKVRAYFMALVARACELEALLRIFDFVENRRPRDRCYNFKGLIDRAFKRHWIPHDALRYWKKAEHTPLKTCLNEVRELQVIEVGNQDSHKVKRLAPVRISVAFSWPRFQ
jgi:hypothetical protein